MFVHACVFLYYVYSGGARLSEGYPDYPEFGSEFPLLRNSNDRIPQGQPADDESNDDTQGPIRQVKYSHPSLYYVHALYECDRKFCAAATEYLFKALAFSLMYRNSCKHFFYSADSSYRINIFYIKKFNVLL